MIERLGRENVESFQVAMGHSAPERNEPFLRTREMFALKLAVTAEQRAGWRASLLADKRAFLASEVDPAAVTPAQTTSWTTPRDIADIEWFASADDLCRALRALGDLSQQDGLGLVAKILSTNPGIQFDGQTWTYVGFKGGSEPGGLNLTWLLRRTDGRWLVLTAGWNNPEQPLDENAAIQLMQATVGLLAQTP